MLNENLRNIRKSKGISQEELAAKLNVVRQTISKWEQGLSVPDSEMLLSISEVLETPVGILLGETIAASESNELKDISEKLETINLQMAQRKIARRRALHWLFVSLGAVIVIGFVILLLIDSSYMNRDYGNPESAVLGVGLHTLEWVYVRAAPFMLVVTTVGAIATRKKSKPFVS